MARPKELQPLLLLSGSDTPLYILVDNLSPADKDTVS
jgi:hypothetical protein